MEDVVIVGAGPAGLTAAIYVQRAGKHAIVYEKGVPGGQIVKALNVQNYPSIPSISGAELAENLYKHAVELGADIRFEEVTEIRLAGKKKLVITENGIVQAKTIIIATGTSNKRLGVPNEAKFLGNGVSYCATCDGMFFKNKVVAVVGNENAALLDALFLTNYCQKVYLLAPNKLSSDKTLLGELSRKTNFEILQNTHVTEFIGQEKLEGVIIKNSKLTRTLALSGLFVSVGKLPATDGFKNVLQTNNFGYIEAGEDCKTNIPGVFVAGDSRTKKVRQLTTACSDGTVAALAAIEYIK